MCWMTRCVMNAPDRDAAGNSRLFSVQMLLVCRYEVISTECRSFLSERKRFFPLFQLCSCSTLLNERKRDRGVCGVVPNR